MIYGIDFEKEPEELRMYICKPDGTTISELHSAYDRTITLNYGGIHQLEFSVPYQIFDVTTGEYIRNPNVDFVQGHYLVRVEQGKQMKEYFVITSPENSFDGGKEIKSVTCYLRPYELKNKLVRSFKGVKTIREVLNATMESMTEYRIGYIDASVELKYRSFDVDEQTLIDFINDLSENYGAVPQWDTINKKLSFYLDENIFYDEGLEVTYGKYMKSLTETENFDDVITRLYPIGKDVLTINSVNPTGAYYIEDYSFYMYPFERDSNRNVIRHSKYMSDELCHTLLDYQELVTSQNGKFKELLNKRTSLLNSETPLSIELDALKQDMDFIEKQIAVWVALDQSLNANSLGLIKVNSGTTRSGTISITINTSSGSKTISADVESGQSYTVVAANINTALSVAGFTSTVSSANGIGLIQFQYNEDSILDIYPNTDGTGVSVSVSRTTLNKQKSDKQAQIDAKQAQIDIITAQIDTTDAQVAALGNLLSVDNNFSKELQGEWSRYIHEKSWTDTSYADVNDLYEAGVKNLKQISQPIVAYEIESVDLKSAINTPEAWDKVKLGAAVTINYESFGIDIKTKIITIEWQPDSRSMNLTVANTKDIKSGFLKLKDLMKGMVSTSTTVNLSKPSWNKSDDTYKAFNEFIQGKFDANKQAIVAGDNENYSLDKYGLTLKSDTDPLRYLRGLHNILAFTNDGGNTFKHAITPDGIIAENVTGTLGQFARVIASSIIVGDDGTKLPDTVIASSTNWNSMYDNSVIYSDKNLQAAKIYSDNTLVTAKEYTNTINKALTNDLRLKAPLPTSLTLDANGITATVSTDTTKFARLDYRGLYVQNGALQITSTAGTTVIDGGGINAGAIYTGSLNGIYMTIGTDNTVFKADKNGIYLGNANFGSAPFRVDMNGNVVANNITLSGKITTSEISNSDIVGSTLTIGSGSAIFKANNNGIYLGNSTFSSAPFRVSLNGVATMTGANISGNITMTGGSISWGAVQKPAYTAGEVGAVGNTQQDVFNTLTNNGSLQGLFMNNGQLYLNANYINTGYLNADRINGGSITSSEISVTTDVRIGNKLFLSGSNYLNGIYWGENTGFSIYTDPSGKGLFINTPSGGSIYANNRRIDQAQVAVFG